MSNAIDKNGNIVSPSTHEMPMSANIDISKETMIINFDGKNKCLWHSDCDNKHGGVMKELKREEDCMFMECLHCGKKGRYPVGGIGRIRVYVATA